MNIAQLTNTIVAAANNELKNKMIAIVTQATQGRPDQQQLVALVTGAADQAIQQIGAGSGTISVPVAAAPAPSTPGFASNMQIGQSPLGSLPGFSPAGGFNNQPIAAAAPGKMPANTVLTLRECGPVVRVSSQQYPQAPPQGAKCGVEFKQKDANNGNPIFCAKDATAINSSTNTWCCKTHEKRKTVDLGGKGGKKSGPTSGNALVGPGAQLRGISNPNNIPSVFGTAPQTQLGIAGIMGQNPFQNQNPFGGGLAPPQTFNPNQGMSLMNSVPGAASAIPSQQAPTINPINFSNMMAVPPPNAMSIGVPFNPMGVQVTVNDNDESDNEDNSEEGSDEHGDAISMPNSADLAKALAAGNMNLAPFTPAGLPPMGAVTLPGAPLGGFSLPTAVPMALPQAAAPQTTAPDANALLMQALSQAQAPQVTTAPMPVPQSPAPITLESALAAATQAK